MRYVDLVLLESPTKRKKGELEVHQTNYFSQGRCVMSQTG